MVKTERGNQRPFPIKILSFRDTHNVSVLCQWTKPPSIFKNCYHTWLSINILNHIKAYKIHLHSSLAGAHFFLPPMLLLLTLIKSSHQPFPRLFPQPFINWLISLPSAAQKNLSETQICSKPCLKFCNCFFFIKIELIYHVVPISSVQKSDSHRYILISFLYYLPPCSITRDWI